MSTFVSIGNSTQSFSRLIVGIASIARYLPQPVVIQHGNTSVPDEWRDSCVWLPFVDMEKFEKLMREAELLALHGGAGSLIHAISANRLPVVMPRLSDKGEHVDDHQVEFVEALAKEGKLILVHSVEELLPACQEACRREGEHRAESPDLHGESMKAMIAELLGRYSN